MKVEPKEFQFRALMGFLSWMTSTVRPDLSIVLTLLGSKTHCGINEQDVRACQHMIRYLRSTQTLGLTYRADDPLLNKLIAFCDASFEPTRCVASYVILLNGAAISWRSWKIKKVCGSTGEAETVALHGAAQQVRYLRNLIKEFGFDQDKLSTPIFSDSQVAITMCLLDKSAKSRHYANHVNYIKESLALGAIHIKYCPTKKMLADILTKLGTHSVEDFKSLRNLVMGVNHSPMIMELDSAPTQIITDPQQIK